MNINLHIERLVLDGIELHHHDRPALQAAVDAELSCLLAEQGAGSHLRAGVAVPRLTTDAIRLTGNDPVMLGKQIALAVHGGLNQ